MKCKCGYENKDEDLVCGMCGAPLNKQDDDEEGEQEGSSVEEDEKGDEKEDEASEKADSSGWGASEHTEVIRRDTASLKASDAGVATGSLMSGKNVMIVIGLAILMGIIGLVISGMTAKSIQQGIRDTEKAAQRPTSGYELRNEIYYLSRKR